MNFNRLHRSVEPNAAPISLEEVKAHLRLVGNDEDEYLASLIEAATAMIEGPHGIGIALMPQTWEYSMDKLEARFTLPLYPVLSMDKIEWEDREGVAYANSSDLSFNKRTNPVRVTFDLDEHFQAREGSVVVSFRAGFDTVPADLRHAILMLVGHYYANAEATSEKKLETVPMAVDTILARYRAA